MLIQFLTLTSFPTGTGRLPKHGSAPGVGEKASALDIASLSGPVGRMGRVDRIGRVDRVVKGDEDPALGSAILAGLAVVVGPCKSVVLVPLLNINRMLGGILALRVHLEFSSDR